MGKTSSLSSDRSELSKTWADRGEFGALVDIGAVASMTDLQARISESVNACGWTGGNAVLHLGMDSLDEGWLNIGLFTKP
jgi:hypothetical protein